MRASTGVLTSALLGWAILLWLPRRRQHRRRRAGQHARPPILNGTRDLAVALVDVTQYVARLTEALATLLLPHEMERPSQAAPLPRRRGDRLQQRLVRLSRGPEGPRRFILRLHPGQRVGLVGHSGGGKTSTVRAAAALRRRTAGRIRSTARIPQLTQQSLREAISVVPQDISLFHRSIMENIRYGRPTATEDEVLPRGHCGALPILSSRCRNASIHRGDRGVKLSGGHASASPSRGRS